MLKIGFCDDDLSILKELQVLLDHYRVEKNRELAYTAYQSPLELLVGWWDGLSSQFTLAFQMGIMVVVCATCARSPQVNRLLNKMSSMVHSRTTALVLMMIFGYVTSMMNYAFCTIVTPILAM